MKLGTRETLLANNKPALKQIIINGTTYFMREFTVGELNKALYGQQQELLRIAKEQGIELNFEDEDTLSKQLAQIYDPYRLPRTLATRLCDEDGNNLFDPNNQQDLEQLSKLDKAAYEQFSAAISALEPKNLPTDADSK